MHKKILHINTEKNWRGGENQILQFIKTSSEVGDIENHVACKKDSEVYKRFKKEALTTPLTSNFLKNLVSLKSYIKKNNISNIITHTSKAHFLGIILKASLPNTKLFVYRKVNNPIKKGFLKSWKYQTNLIDHFISISDIITTTLINGQISKERILQSRDFIIKKDITPDSLYKLRSTLSSKLNNNFIITCAAHLDQQKNIKTLIRALSVLKKERSVFHCFIAGKGPLKEELEEFTKSLGLTEHITFLGFTEQLPELLSLSNIFVLPSINEGFGSVLIEATIYDCALIGTNSGGIPELIKDEETGLLFEAKNHIELANKITKLMESPELIKNLTGNAQDAVLKRFDPKNAVKQILEALK